MIRKGGVMDFDFLPTMATLTSWRFHFISDKVASIDGGILVVLGVLIGLDTEFLVWLLKMVGVL